MSRRNTFIEDISNSIRDFIHENVKHVTTKTPIVRSERHSQIMNGKNSNFDMGIIHSNTEENNESSFVSIIDIPTDKAPFINLPREAKVFVSLSLGLTLVIGTYYKICLYKGVFKTNKENRGWMHRPINVLIFVAALIHHLTHLVICIYFILALTIETPLQNIFGPFYCFMMMLVGTFAIAYQAVGSFGIGLYRIMYILFNSMVKYRIGETRLLLLILGGSIGVSSTITFLHMIESSSRRVAINMCTRMSPAETQVVIDYQQAYQEARGEHLMVSTIFQKISIAATLIIQVSELSIYIFFSIWRYKQANGNIARLLGPVITRKRNTNNVITFSGQFYGFVVEAIVVGALMLLNHVEHAEQLNLSASFSHTLMSIGIVIYFLNFGVLSAVEVLMSPALQGS